MYHNFQRSERAGYRGEGKEIMSQHELDGLRTRIDSLNLEIALKIKEIMEN